MTVVTKISNEYIVTLKVYVYTRFSCVPGMAFIQSELNRPRVVTAKCSEPQVIISNGNDDGSGVAILSSVRTET